MQSVRIRSIAAVYLLVTNGLIVGKPGTKIPSELFLDRQGDKEPPRTYNTLVLSHFFTDHFASPLKQPSTVIVLFGARHLVGARNASSVYTCARHDPPGY